jgi:serine/threonine-protein kinase SRPK3
MAGCIQFTNTEFVNLDIKLDNIQEALPDEDTEVLTRLVEAERRQPSPQKIITNGTTIYTSHSLDYESGVVCPILTDLGMAVFGSAEYTHTIQAIPYRAPEVILGMKWNERVDIWNLGIVVSKEKYFC